MGHKVHPKSFRLGVTITWPSRWFARGATYRKQLQQDLEIREYVKKQLKDGAVSKVAIERSQGVVGITIHTGKPGFVIGRSAAGIEELRKKLQKEFFRGKKVNLRVDVVEVPKANLDAAIVAQQVVSDLERRLPFRRALKQTIERVKKSGALGVKVSVSGRLNGAEIARREWLGWGKIPLTSLRADIDYANAMARTQAGAIGVKVWIYRGDVFEQDRLSIYQPTTPSRNPRDRRRGGGPGGDRGSRSDRGPAPGPKTEPTS
ncbi:30S ribosomal protein S3 [Candidatus Uhrbacteria bacterium]|nr:30S ribosomal protein S3 [Candidatus Uhrbacteria bacterium]MBD3284404.1 30S ribosomal protein S3 [Candidatus Uhrbacteria bacterium]